MPKTVNVVVGDEARERLDAEAARSGRTLSELVRDRLEHGIEFSETVQALLLVWATRTGLSEAEVAERILLRFLEQIDVPAQIVSEDPGRRVDAHGERRGAPLAVL